MITTLTKGQVPLPIDHEIRSRLEDGRADTFLHIVPTDHARLKWHSEYLSNTPNRAIAGLQIYSLEYLVRLLYRWLNKGRRRIGGGIQAVWAHEIMEEEELPFFGPPPGDPVPQGTARQLREAVNQLKTTGVEWHQLQENPVLSDVGSPAKLADLITFYQAYETRLGAQWVDRADLHRAVSEILDQKPAHAERLMKRIFPDVDLVIVSGFDVLSPHDFAILTGIANLRSIKMGIVLDFDKENEALFGHIKAVYDQFLSCGFEGHRGEMEPSQATRNPHFTQNLFRTDREDAPSIEKLNLTDQVSLLFPTNRVQEVEAIAKLIKRLALSYPSPALSQICVTFYSLDAYAPLIREIFPLYGIPYSLEWNERLENSTVVASIFALLDRIRGNDSSQTREQVERSPYFRAHDWDSVIDNCGLNVNLSPRVFKESFDRLMETLKVRQQILKGSWECKTKISVDKMNAYRQFRRLIDELVDFLILRSGAEARYPLGSHIHWLKLMASQASYQWANPSDTGVRILPLLQTKDLSFDTVILGGLVDGEFPAVFRADTFLPSKQRGTESDRLQEDRFLFYQALTLYHEQLYLLSPQYDDNIELTPSAFIEELQRVAEINTAVDDDDTLFSTERFRKHYGTHVWENLETNRVKEPPVPSTILPRLDLIAHNVRVEGSRTVTHNLPQYEGHLLSDLLSTESRRALEWRREWTYSVSQLETYGACPFRYFSNRVLNLNLPKDEETGLTSLEKGSLAHKILFEFYDGRRDTPPISEYKDPEFEEAVRVLQQIAQTHLDARAAELGLKGADKLFWEMEVERLIGGHGRRGVLPAFLEAEKKRNVEVQPRCFEVAFGPSNRSEPADPFIGSEEPIPIGKILLAGRIDRIELGNGMFVIGDYKTGRSTPKMGDIREGRSLQLPIYIAIAEQLLRQQPSPIPGFEGDLESVEGVAGVYYVLQEESKVELGIGGEDYNGTAFPKSRSGQVLSNADPQTDDTEPDAGFDEFRSVIDASIDHANKYVDSIAKGDFPLTSHDKTKVCRYCSFKRICRVGAIAEDVSDRQTSIA